MFVFVFVFKQLTQEQLYPVRIKVPRNGQQWAFKEFLLLFLFWHSAGLSLACVHFSKA